MALSVDIEKRLGDFHLKVKFDAGNEVLSLLGASGCGKTMTLKCIAGIETPDRGRIELDGRVLFDSEQRINLPPQKRREGYIFQQYALFPNMTVEQNIRCGIRDKVRQEAVLSEILEVMELTSLRMLRPHQLSGGQQQRVALARILVNEPEVLLLDEPFSALDSHLRFRMEQEVRQVLSRFPGTAVLVSHDRDEVFRLSQSIGIMAEGKLEVLGEKQAVFRDPVTKNGAILTGCKNISAARWLDKTHVLAEDWGLTLTLPEGAEQTPFIGIRMHDIQEAGAENRFCLEVAEEIENPFSYTIMLRKEGGTGMIGWQMSKEKWAGLRNGSVTVCLPPEKLLLLK